MNGNRRPGATGRCYETGPTTIRVHSHSFAAHATPVPFCPPRRIFPLPTLRTTRKSPSETAARNLPGKMIAIFSKKTRIFPIKKSVLALERSPMCIFLEQNTTAGWRIFPRLEKCAGPSSKCPTKTNAAKQTAQCRRPEKLPNLPEVSRARENRTLRNSRFSGKCGVCHRSFVIGLFTDRRPSCPVCQCPDVSENRTKIAPAIFRKFRKFATALHPCTTSLLHPFMPSRWTLPPAAPRSMPAKISKISSRFSKKTTSIGKYGKYTCVFPEENAYFPLRKLFYALLENINPVFSRAKSISRRTPLGKYGNYDATEVATRCRQSRLFCLGKKTMNICTKNH